jgi:peptide/nickel transport system substrate-binding protein
VKLRDGVTWSDGRPFSADDVVYTLEMLAANGRGKKDLTQSSGVADAVKAVTKVDPLTVKIDLTQPDPRFAYKYLINYFDIGLQWLPAHIWKDVADPASFSFFDLAKGWQVTTGPWKVTRFTDNQKSSTVVRNGGRSRLHPPCRSWNASSSFRRHPRPHGATDHRQSGRHRQRHPDHEVLKQIAPEPKITTFTEDQAPYGAGTGGRPRSTSTTSPANGPTSGYVAPSAVSRPQAAIYGMPAPANRNTIRSRASVPEIPYIDAIRPADKCPAISTRPGDALMQADPKRFRCVGEGRQPLAAVIEASGAQRHRPGGGTAAQEQRHRCQLPLDPESRAVMRDGKYDLCLFGHRGSISDPYATLEIYHSRNAFDVGRPTCFRRGPRRLRRSSTSRWTATIRCSIRRRWRSGCAKPSRRRFGMVSPRTDEPDLLTGWPSEKNPTCSHRSGTPQAASATCCRAEKAVVSAMLPK